MHRKNREDAEHEVVSGEKRNVTGRHRSIVVATLILLCAAELLYPAVAGRFGFPGLVIDALVALALWAVVWRSGFATPLVPLIIVAAFLRIVLLFATPALSGDVYRYAWDGNVSLHGINPYRYAPRAPELMSLRSTDFARINHPEIPTIYPPYAQFLFAIAAAFRAQITGWRVLLSIADLGFIAFLFRRVSPRVALAWAVSPLVIIEGAWSGHVDLVAAILVTLAVVLLRERLALAAFLLAAATGVKITPIASLPSMIQGARRRTMFAAVFVVSLALPLVPFAIAGNLMRGFSEYAHQWEFDAPVFIAIRSMIDSATIPQILKTFWTATKDRIHAEVISDFVYHHLDANFLARAMCAFIAVVAIAFVTRSVLSIERKCAWSIAALLLASPTIHPWYWLPVLALALPAGDLVLIALAHCSLASYLLYGERPAVLLAPAIAYGVPLAVAIFTRRAGGNSPARASARAS